MTNRHNQRGANLAEAALTMLLLFTIIFGIIEFGRAFNVYQVVTNATREGARYAVAPDPITGTVPDVSAVQARVTQFLTSGNITASTAPTVCSNNRLINGAPEVYTNVHATAPYHFFFLPFGTINISATAEMRNEVSSSTAPGC